MPSTDARPSSSGMIVVRMRTAVVLPAPFGPSSPSTVPASTPKDTPSSATTSPNRLRTSSTTIVVSLMPAILAHIT